MTLHSIFKLEEKNGDNSNLNILAKYHLRDSTFCVEEILPTSIPKFYIDNDLFYNLLTIHFKFPYCLFGYSNEFYKIGDDSSYTLPYSNEYFYQNKTTRSVKADFKCNDFIESNDYLHILTYNYTDTSYYISIVDKETNSFIQFPHKIDFELIHEVPAGFINTRTIYMFRDKEIYFINL